MEDFLLLLADLRHEIFTIIAADRVTFLTLVDRDELQVILGYLQYDTLVSLGAACRCLTPACKAMARWRAQVMHQLMRRRPRDFKTKQVIYGLSEKAGILPKLRNYDRLSYGWRKDRMDVLAQGAEPGWWDAQILVGADQGIQHDFRVIHHLNPVDRADGIMIIPDAGAMEGSPLIQQYCNRVARLMIITSAQALTKASTNAGTSACKMLDAEAENADLWREDVLANVLYHLFLGPPGIMIRGLADLKGAGLDLSYKPREQWPTFRGQRLPVAPLLLEDAPHALDLDFTFSGLPGCPKSCAHCATIESFKVGHEYNPTKGVWEYTAHLQHDHTRRRARAPPRA